MSSLEKCLLNASYILNTGLRQEHSTMQVRCYLPYEADGEGVGLGTPEQVTAAWSSVKQGAGTVWSDLGILCLSSRVLIVVDLKAGNYAFITVFSVPVSLYYRSLIHVCGTNKLIINIILNMISRKDYTFTLSNLFLWLMFISKILCLNLIAVWKNLLLCFQKTGKSLYVFEVYCEIVRSLLTWIW